MKQSMEEQEATVRPEFLAAVRLATENGYGQPLAERDLLPICMASLLICVHDDYQQHQPTV